MTAPVLIASVALGAGSGFLISQVQSIPGKTADGIQSVTGVESGVDGTNQPEPSEPEKSPDPTSQSTDPNTSQQVESADVKGTRGPDATIENPAEVFTPNATMQSIRGIKGIDTVVLENLEVVLRLQAPPVPPTGGGGGGGRAAAELLTQESEEPIEPEEEPDGREELEEFELEGS